jgi:hypothetical protein
VQDILTSEEFHAALAAAGSKLVVLEAQSEEVCMTGLDEEPELHWRADQEAALRPCVSIKHTFQRTARECPDVVFLSLLVRSVFLGGGWMAARGASQAAGRCAACQLPLATLQRRRASPVVLDARADTRPPPGPGRRR